MAGRRARTGRGWDAAPPRPRRKPSSNRGATAARESTDTDSPLDARGPADADEAAIVGGSAGTARGGRSSASQVPSEPPADPYETAREICLRLLSLRPRTRSELATAMRRKGIDDEISAAVLDRYDEVGLIDDAAFARAWVSSRHHGRGLARRALASELRRRGVDADLVNEALDEVDGDTEAATARTLVERKLRGMSATPPDAIFRRLVAMLARKGYPAAVAISAVKDALAERAQSAEFAAELDVDVLADMELGEGG